MRSGFFRPPTAQCQCRQTPTPHRQRVQESNAIGMPITVMSKRTPRTGRSRRVKQPTPAVLSGFACAASLTRLVAFGAKMTTSAPRAAKASAVTIPPSKSNPKLKERTNGLDGIKGGGGGAGSVPAIMVQPTLDSSARCSLNIPTNRGDVPTHNTGISHRDIPAKSGDAAVHRTSDRNIATKIDYIVADRCALLDADITAKTDYAVNRLSRANGQGVARAKNCVPL